MATTTTASGLVIEAPSAASFGFCGNGAILSRTWPPLCNGSELALSNDAQV